MAHCADISKQTRSDGCLLVAFEPAPTLVLTGSCPTGQFRMDGRLYKEAGDYGDWTGFYDWLRQDSGHIVGVRYSPFQETEFLIEAVKGLAYVVIPEPKRCIEVYFSPGSGSRGVDPSESDDQAFGSNRIFYCNEQSRYLISFDTSRLSESEMQSIRTSKARWETVSMPANGGEAKADARSAGA